MYLPIDGAMLVLWIHILAATVWIGGQITLLALVPLLRAAEGMATAAARRFQWIAWTAFVILLVTGVANGYNAHIGWSDLHTTPAGRTLSLKLGFVVLSGIGAAVHAYYLGPRAGRAPSRRARAVSGAFAGIGLLAAMVAALYGVVIAEH